MHIAHLHLLLGALLRRDHLFWIAVVLIIASGFYLTFWAVRKRRSIWKKFAAVHGVSYLSASAHPRIEGRVDSRNFSMLVTDRSSDRGLFGIELIEMRLAIDTGIKAAFDITNEGPAITALREATGDDGIVHVTADEFDQSTASRSEDTATLREFLTDERRSAILTLIDECAGCDVHVTPSEIVVTERTMVKSMEGLTQRLAAIRKAAASLDDHSTSIE